MLANPRLDLDSIRVTDIRLEQALVAGRFDLRFDVAWAGSWRFDEGRRGGNWDAAWVFVKASRVPSLGADDGLVEALETGDPDRLYRLLRQRGLSIGRTLTTTTTEDGWLVHLTLRRKPQKPGEQREEQKIRFKVSRTAGEVVTSTSFDWMPTLIDDVTHCPAKAVVVPGDGHLGVFIHRSRDNSGLGPVRFRNVGLRLRLPDGSAPNLDDLSISVFALNMVYIPEAPFWAGDYRGQVDQAFFDSCSLNNPEGTFAYRVDSEDPIEVADAKGECPEGKKYLFYRSYQPLRAGGDQRGPIPAAFPKGHRAFYVMKSHVTQGEYAEFINHLPATAKTQRYPYEDGAYRYTIARDRSMKRIARRPRRACNVLAWADGIAYTAWAGLRPMTELEFEKACRGPKLPVTREFAWGNTELVPAQIIVGPGTTELAVSGNCNVANAFILFNGGDGASGPIRDDALRVAGSPEVETQRAPEGAVDPRTGNGSSYYGVLGLSGNLWEQCITVGNPEGRAFTGRHGTGVLTPAGSAPATELEWPGDSGIGSGFRGGTWFTDSDRARLADRWYGAGLSGFFFRSLDTGFRCAATAPEDDE